MEAIAAKPQYDIGDVVRYEDRNNRIQEGRIFFIQATWSGFRTQGKPLVVYSIEHPTYRNNTFHTGEDSIHHIV